MTKSAAEFLSCVKAQLGKPYKWGEVGPNYFDCSGLVFYCLDGKIKRKSCEQFKGGQPGDGSPGDLVFFGDPGKDVSHVGVCLGNGEMIHAPEEGKVVCQKRYIDNPYFKPRIKGYRRYWT